MENYLINDIKEHFETLMNARSLAVSNDKRVLEFLLEISNFKDEYKDRFFTQICGALIFKKDEFLNFLDLKLLSDSYTSFSNKIGLGTAIFFFVLFKIRILSNLKKFDKIEFKMLFDMKNL